MSRLLRTAPLGLALVSCGAQPIDVFLPLAPETRAVVLALEGVGRFEVYAYDASAPGFAERFSAVLTTDSRLQLTAVLFEVPLADFGLAEGKLEDTVEGRSRTLPFERGRVLEARVEGKEAEAWATVSMPSGALRSFRVPELSPCIEFVPRTFALGTQANLAGIVRETEESALIFAGFDDLMPEEMLVYRATRDGVTRLAAPNLPSFYPVAVDRTPDGRIFLAGACTDGSCGGKAPSNEYLVAVGDLENGFQFLPSRGFATGYRRIKRMAVSDAGEVYTLTFGGTMERYAQGQWSLLFDDRGPTDEVEGGGVAVDGESDVYFAYRQASAMLHYDGSMIRQEALAVEGAPTSVKKIDGVGMVMGAGSGHILHRQGNRWEVLGVPPVTNTVLAVESNGNGGFVYTAFFGPMLQWHAGFGYCPADQIIAALNPYSLVRIGDAYVIGGDRISSGGNERADLHVVIATPR